MRVEYVVLKAVLLKCVVDPVAQLLPRSYSMAEKGHIRLIDN